MARLWIALLAATAGVPNAVVTVYRVGDHGAYASTTTTAAAAGYTGSAAYDPTVLDPPAPPEQLNREFVVLDDLGKLPQAEPNGTSGPIPGSYLGFSIELSVANRIIGKNSSVLAVPFLNHMANVANRVGAVRVRVGGNSKDPSLTQESNTTTWTLHVEFAPDLVKMLANYASLVKTETFLGLNFMDLEKHIEPRGLCGSGGRDAGFQFARYRTRERAGLWHWRMKDAHSVSLTSSRLSRCSGTPTTTATATKTPSRSLPTTSPTTKSPNTPHNTPNSPAWSKRQENRCTCSKPTQPHAATSPASPTRSGQDYGRPDWALKLTSTGFSSTLLHVGGQGRLLQSVHASLPTNQSTFRQWTTGSVYYSALIAAQVFGKSGKSRIMDLDANAGENLTLGYVVYEDGVPSRVLLINYVDDPSGAHDITANIQIEGGAQLSQVRVRYFEAPSVSFKGNIT
ncbi:unnamed protein product [Rhizoctonia solani]|uniref:Beta-glucuronidase C-terminal domain-containing protein n=1 Tax=Rhizoctonia solani TaxID=456999 RepID=A0A8H3BXA0_9AGAM|nr:unnamed protein product [Rhizoctonia solani]